MKDTWDTWDLSFLHVLFRAHVMFVDSLLQTQVSVLSGEVASVIHGVSRSAAVWDDHGTVVSVHTESWGRAVRRHDDEHRDSHLHSVMSYCHWEVTVCGHDHTFPLLILRQTQIQHNTTHVHFYYWLMFRCVVIVTCCSEDSRYRTPLSFTEPV